MATLLKFPEFDHYVVSRVLGEGGMGIVFQAEDRRTGLSVAAKVMSRGLQDDELQARFIKEMQILASLNHRNIVRCYEVVRSREGLPTIVMEYLEGVDLHAFEGRPFPELIPLAIQSAMGLAYLQKLNILHRDLSSNNILVSLINDRRLVKIVDFGVAKVLQEGNAGELTQTGEFLGKLGFASPELLILSAADFRSDIYSLGVIFFRMLTKRRPLHVQNSRNYLEWVKAHERRAPLDFTVPPGCPPVPPALQALVTKMLERDPSQRPQGYDEIIDTLVAIQSDAEKAGLVPDPATLSTLPPKADGTGSPVASGSPAASGKPAESWVVPSNIDSEMTSAMTSAGIHGMEGVRPAASTGTPDWLAPADRLEELSAVASKDRDKYAYRPPSPTGINRTDVTTRRRAEAAEAAAAARAAHSGPGAGVWVAVLATLVALGGAGFWAWNAFLRDMLIPAPMATLEPHPSNDAPAAADPRASMPARKPAPVVVASAQPAAAPSNAEGRGLTTANVVGFLPNPAATKAATGGAVLLLGFKRPANVYGLASVRIVAARDSAGQSVEGFEGRQAELIRPEDPTGARLVRLLLDRTIEPGDPRLLLLHSLEVEIGPGRMLARLEKNLLSN